MDASDFFPETVARLISPEFPFKVRDKDKCVSFELYLSGQRYPGRLEVFNDLLQMYWSSQISKTMF